LISTGRFKVTGCGSRREIPIEQDMRGDSDSEDYDVVDDRLRLIFTCCHPALHPDAQVAMTLREICGLTTEQVAAAFLTTAPTLAQRIVRAKAKIRDARIPYEIPERRDLPERLATVLHVVYLVFNQGYFTLAGSRRRSDPPRRLLVELLPEPRPSACLPDAAPRCSARHPHFERRGSSCRSRSRIGRAGIASR
jgi:RNA polymerase sigma-70 factor (ECF subfamily)